VQSADIVVIQEEPFAKWQITECIAIHLEDLVVLQVQLPQPNVIGEGILIQGHYVIVVQDNPFQEGQICERIALDYLHLRVFNHNAAQVLQRFNYHGGYIVQSGIVLDHKLQFPQTLLLIESRPGGVILMQSLGEHPALGLLHWHVVLIRGTVAH